MEIHSALLVQYVVWMVDVEQVVVDMQGLRDLSSGGSRNDVSVAVKGVSKQWVVKEVKKNMLATGLADLCDVDG